MPHRFSTRRIPLIAMALAALLGRGQVTLGQQPGGGQIAQLGVLDGFSDWVVSVAFSPDGKQLATGSYDVVKVWDVETRELQQTLEPGSGYVKALVFSPDGRLLASGSYKRLTLWDTQNWKEDLSLQGHRGFVTDVAFTPDGKRRATSCDDGKVRVWADDGKLLRTLEAHTYPVQAVAYSPDGSLLATAAGDETRVTRPGEVFVWDAETGDVKWKLAEHKKAATDVAFSPDGKWLLSTSVDETVSVHDLSNGELHGYFGGHSRPTNAVVFAPDGKTVVTGSGGRAKGKNEIKLWEPVSGDERASFEAHPARVAAVALTPDGKVLATASYDQTVALWNVAPLLETKSPREPIAADKTAALELAQREIAAVNENAAAEETQSQPAASDTKVLRAGIIGLDTSHAIAFTKALNDPDAAADIADCKVVAAYPKGSPDIESSVVRVPGYTQQVREMGVEIVDSIEELLEKVDVVMLETNDGRPHLEQALPVLRAGKPLFVDKPIAGSLADAVAIFDAAARYHVPVFSSSSLRYSEGAQALRNGKIGEIVGCDAYSPCSLEATHPDLFWYGIHGVETLFTVMGTGCETASRTSAPNAEVVVGLWDGGRIGTFRGIRETKSGYGGTAFGTKGIEQIGPYGGYRPLIAEIVQFFRTGVEPISRRETLEIYAFMAAADESKRQGGGPVSLDSVLAQAYEEAAAKLDVLDAEYEDNTLTERDKAEGWELLFNGEDFTGWKCNNDRKIAAPIEDGALVPHKSGGYLIIHEREFGDFVFECDVKMPEECNSGIFFRVGDPRNPVQTGFEAQVLSGEGAGYHDFGAIYDLVAATKNVSRGPGVWNHVSITCRGPHISVAVNGETVSELDCDEFTKPGERPDGTKHKFKSAVKDFPRHGYLGFQDHGHKVWYKNVKILELD